MGSNPFRPADSWSVKQARKGELTWTKNYCGFINWYRDIENSKLKKQRVRSVS